MQTDRRLAGLWSSCRRRRHPALTVLSGGLDLVRGDIPPTARNLSADTGSAIVILVVDDLVLPGPRGDFYAVTDAELFLDAGGMGLDRAERDEQLGCDLLASAPFGDAAGDLEFSFRELVCGSGAGRTAGGCELLEEADGDRG